MKNMRRIASLVLALVMVLALAISASAYTITAPDNGHTYEVYQIFTGDLSKNETGEDVLSNVVWGKNGTGTEGEKVSDEILDELKNTTGTDVQKLAVITKYANINAENKYGTVTSTAPLTNVPAGYYLIKDVDKSLEGKENEAYTHYIVQIVNDVVIAPKADTPEVDKEIKDEGDAADYSIGDDVPFVLTATLPNNVDDYETYKVVFNDTLSDGLTYNGDAIVKVGDDVVYNAKDTTQNKAGVTVTNEGNKLTITITDVKTLGGVNSGTVTVEYTAELNENAVIGNGTDTTPGNYNTVDLDYSNNPNNSGEGHTPEGDTPDDTVVVFTYQLDVDKVNASNAKLSDAEFVLYRGEGDAIEYVQVNNGKVTGWTSDKTKASTLTSVNGEFSVSGLDAGTYYLEETKAPAGYNLLEKPVIVTISAEITDTETEQKVTALNITVNDQVNDAVNGTGHVATGIVDATIVNQAGSTLPETGGIGTTMFYVFGGILVAAAVVLLITKRRMSVAE